MQQLGAPPLRQYTVGKEGCPRFGLAPSVYLCAVSHGRCHVPLHPLYAKPSSSFSSLRATSYCSQLAQGCQGLLLFKRNVVRVVPSPIFGRKLSTD